MNGNLADALRRFASPSLDATSGAAAAFAGSVGAALLCMVARVALKRRPTSPVKDDLTLLLRQAEAKQHEFEVLIESDPEAYRHVARWRREMRQNPSAGSHLQEALKEATKVPLDIARASYACLEVAASLADIGEPETMAEVGTGAHLCYAALHGALYTAAANLKDIGDLSFVANVRAESSGLARAGDILNKVATRVAEITCANKTLQRS